VMLYKIHIASARSLDVPVKGADLRQEAPQDLDDSNVYYRSQDKGHPVITLYKDLITMANDGVERKRILAPYNPDVRALIESATPNETQAKRSINTIDIQGVLHRQKVKPKKEPASPPPEPVVYGEKHTEMSAGYIGLRRNNADVIEGAVAKLLDTHRPEPDRVADLDAIELRPGAGAPAAAHRPARRDQHRPAEPGGHPADRQRARPDRYRQAARRADQQRCQARAERHRSLPGRPRRRDRAAATTAPGAGATAASAASAAPAVDTAHVAGGPHARRDLARTSPRCRDQPRGL
jgi:hypothetical protein